MGLQELLLATLRFVHLLAAVIWTGGGLLLVLAYPAEAPLDETAWDAAWRATRARLREAMSASALALIATGVVLTFDRLSHTVGTAYAVLLAAKIALAVVAFLLVYGPRRAKGGGRASRRVIGVPLAVVVSVAILFVVALLRAVYEVELAGG